MGLNVDLQKQVVKMLKAVDALEEYKNFVTDICFDYKDKPEIGLMAIRVLSKGKQDEETFTRVWMKWRETIGAPVKQFLAHTCTEKGEA